MPLSDQRVSNAKSAAFMPIKEEKVECFQITIGVFSVVAYMEFFTLKRRFAKELGATQMNSSLFGVQLELNQCVCYIVHCIVCDCVVGHDRLLGGLNTF